MTHKNFIKIVLKKIGNDQKLFEEYLLAMLTPGEYKEINNRWEILKLLDSGVSQHEIAQKLGVGVATVSRGSKVLKDSTPAFRKLLK
jgi:TrpR family trp operon transcriptional repressor